MTGVYIIKEIDLSDVYISIIIQSQVREHQRGSF